MSSVAASTDKKKEPKSYDPAVNHPALHGLDKKDTVKPKDYDATKCSPVVVCKRRKQWLPLESDPELMNKYIHNLGVSKDFVFHEIYSPDLIMMVPQPVYAVLMLFPVSAASEKHRKEEEAKLVKDGQKVSDKVFFLRQIIGNACGTIGLCHAVCNNADKLDLQPGFFKNFVKETKGMDYMQRAEALEKNEDIEVAHQHVAREAKSDVTSSTHDNLHFNAWTVLDGDLYELDGRKQRPINHGPCTNLLADSMKVIKGFMARDPKDIRFNLVALGKKA
jgi:ubiquitin carboxyl-terminal hydrolase L3